MTHVLLLKFQFIYQAKSEMNMPLYVHDENCVHAYKGMNI